MMFRKDSFNEERNGPQMGKASPAPDAASGLSFLTVAMQILNIISEYPSVLQRARYLLREDTLNTGTLPFWFRLRHQNAGPEREGSGQLRPSSYVFVIIIRAKVKQYNHL